MKHRIRRTLSMILAVIMILTMPGWNNLADTVYADTVTGDLMPWVKIYLYNGKDQYQNNFAGIDQELVKEFRVKIRETKQETPTSGIIPQDHTYVMGKGAPDGATDPDSWYCYSLQMNPTVATYEVVGFEVDYYTNPEKTAWATHGNLGAEGNRSVTRLSNIYFYVSKNVDSPKYDVPGVSVRFLDEKKVFSPDKFASDTSSNVYYAQAGKEIEIKIGAVLDLNQIEIKDNDTSVETLSFKGVEENSTVFTYRAETAGNRSFQIVDQNTGKTYQIQVRTYAAEDKIYVLDYGLLVNLTDNDKNNTNPLFANQKGFALDGVNDKEQYFTFVGIKSAQETAFSYRAEGSYGVMEGAMGTQANSQVIYTPNKFLSGIDEFEYQVCVGKMGIKNNERNSYNSVTMTAGITIMPASIVYYEDNFAAIQTNGDVIDPNGPYDMVSSSLEGSQFTKNGTWRLAVKDSNPSDYPQGYEGPVYFTDGQKSLFGNCNVPDGTFTSHDGSKTITASYVPYPEGRYCNYHDYNLGLKSQKCTEVGTASVIPVVEDGPVDYYDYIIESQTAAAKPEDICLVLTGVETANGTVLGEKEIVNSMIPGNTYLFRCVWDQNMTRYFTIGFVREKEETKKLWSGAGLTDNTQTMTNYELVSGTRFMVMQNTNANNVGNYVYVEFTVPEDIDLTGCSFAVCFGNVEGENLVNTTSHLRYPSLVGVTAGVSAEAPREQSNSLDMQHGYDPFYTNSENHSFDQELDANTQITPDIQEEAADSNKAENFTKNNYTLLDDSDTVAFEFQGTGFDILAKTSNANLSVKVYDAADYELQSRILSNGRTLYAAVKKEGSAASGPVKSVIVNASYENGEIYQIPVVSIDLEKSGNYIVIASRMGGTDPLYIDGIRIYNPLNEADQEIADEYYEEAGETGVTIRQIREMIFGAGYVFDKEKPQQPGEDAVAGLVCETEDGKLNIVTGNTVIECSTLTSPTESAVGVDMPMSTSSMLDYAVSGPNNELYLSGAKNAFAAVVETLEDGTASIQIGLKAVNEGENVTVQYKAEDGSWKEVAALSSSLEMYYEIPVNDLYKAQEKKLLLLRVADHDGVSGTVSMTNLKYKGVSFKKIVAADFSDDHILDTVDKNAAPFAILSSKNNAVTFSVSDASEGFQLKASQGVMFQYKKETGEIAFSDAFANAGWTNENVTVGIRCMDGLNIYVVRFKGKALTAGNYEIVAYDNKTDVYAPASFEVK